MSDTLRHVQPGDPFEIRSQTFNTIIDATRAFVRSKHDRDRESQRIFHQTGIVLVKNASGDDRKRFDVLGINAPIISPDDNIEEFKNRVTFKCSKPKESKHFGKCVVLLEPIGKNEIGRAVVAGVTVARVEIVDPRDRCADIETDTTNNLVSDKSGSAQILWADGTSGVVWAIVRLSNICGDMCEESSSDFSDFSDSLESDESDVGPGGGLTKTVDVLTADPYRDGDNLCFPKQRLHFEDGRLVDVEDLDTVCQYICCDLSEDSSLDESFADESSIGESSEPDESSVSEFSDDSSFDDSSFDDSSFFDDSSSW
jgi:hypothetical protein